MIYTNHRRFHTNFSDFLFPILAPPCLLPTRCESPYSCLFYSSQGLRSFHQDSSVFQQKAPFHTIAQWWRKFHINAYFVTVDEQNVRELFQVEPIHLYYLSPCKSL